MLLPKQPEGALTRQDGARKAHHIGRHLMQARHPQESQDGAQELANLAYNSK